MICFALVALPRVGLTVESYGLRPVLFLYFDLINTNAESECLQTDVSKQKWH